MKINQKLSLFYVLLMYVMLMPPASYSQSLSSEEIKKFSKEKFPEAIVQLRSFLKLPNDGHFEDQVAKNLNWCDSVFTKLDFRTQVITTAGAPLLFAEKRSKKNTKTILFYLQIDGQPVDSTQWDQPSPFDPVLKKKNPDGQWQEVGFDINKNFDPEWRIFARSSSDSKGPAMAFISALQILKSKNINPAFNVKVIMDFQEEMGSLHLPKAVADQKELLAADMLLIMDGTRHVSNLPTLTYGARGIATATLKVFGPRYPLHSGQYGNFAPNPVFETSKLLGGLKDDKGRVTIPGFYDGIELDEMQMQIINNVPEHTDSIKQRLGIAETDAIGETYQEALQYPTLNIRGLNAAWVGDEVRTIIPSEVTVEFDMRLVPESDGDRLMGLLRAYIRNRGYHLVDSIPTDTERMKYAKLAAFTYRLGSLPFRTEMDSPIGRFLNKALNRVFEKQVVNMRTTGGSQPIAAFVKILDTPAVSVRIPNPDNNIHAPNENLRIGNFLEGIQSCLAILDQPLK